MVVETSFFLGLAKTQITAYQLFSLIIHFFIQHIWLRYIYAEPNKIRQPQHSTLLCHISPPPKKNVFNLDNFKNWPCNVQNSSVVATLLSSKIEVIQEEKKYDKNKNVGLIRMTCLLTCLGKYFLPVKQFFFELIILAHCYNMQHPLS